MKKAQQFTPSLGDITKNCRDRRIPYVVSGLSFIHIRASIARAEGADLSWGPLIPIEAEIEAENIIGGCWLLGCLSKVACPKLLIERHFIKYISLHHMLIFYCPARRRFYRAIAL